MASKKGNRPIIGLVCTKCKTRNYVTSRNKVNTPEKLKISKYCRTCRAHTLHKEVAKLK